MAEPKDQKLRAYRRLRRYFDRVLKRAQDRNADPALIHRYRKKKRWALRMIRHRRKVLSGAGKTHGLVWFDGHQVAAWIAAELTKARRAGRWKGHVVSGWRDPLYSERLCYSMCGHPTCPGRCAGQSSRHSGIEYPNGAADVDDFWRLQAECRRLNLRIQNDLPNDRVHFSSDGH